MSKPRSAVTPPRNVLIICTLLACGGRESLVDVPPAPVAQCVDLSTAPECTPDASWPVPPSSLLEATELGAGFEFVSLHEGLALARGPGGWAAVHIEPQRSPQLVGFELVFGGGGAEPSVVRDVWHGALDDQGAVVVVLVCSARACDLYRGAVPDDFGLPTGVLARWEELPSEWEARGIVDLWPYDDNVGYSICVYGRGLSCRDGAGGWHELLAPELGLIRAVSSHLLLTNAGRLLAAKTDGGAVQLPIEWTEVPSAEPLVRLSPAGAFGASGLWLRQTDAGFVSCQQRPALLAGTPPLDALDENGTAFSRQALPPSREYLPCRWPGSIEGPVLGEAYVSCGLGRNWIVLTPARIMAMHGGLLCVVD